MTGFTTKEKKNYMLKKHLKNHWFEYVLDIVGPVIVMLILLYVCKAEKIVLGVVATIGISFGRVIYDILHYKKEYVDIDIKEEEV